MSASGRAGAAVEGPIETARDDAAAEARTGDVVYVIRHAMQDGFRGAPSAAYGRTDPFA